MHRGERVAGRFDIVAEVGRGGMGTVFRARDRKEKRDVALKVLAAEKLSSAPRFEREAEVLAGVHHPNIVDYVAHGETPDGLCYLAMEWVGGENLMQRLEGEGVTAAEAVAIARQLASALAALHAVGVVHRDLKPSNVMLNGSHVKLVDFGVVRVVDDLGALTLTGTMIGTSGYMSPEQARGDADVDERADLFSLGCVLHECLTGTPAFSGATTYITRAKVLLHDPPLVRQLSPELPPPLETLVTRLLAKRPQDRPRDAAEVERALAAVGSIDGPAHPRVGGFDATVTLPPRKGTTVLISWSGPPPALDLPLQPITGGALAFAVDDAEAVRIAREVEAQVPDARIVVTTCDLDTAARVLVDLDVANECGAWRLDADGSRVRLLGE